MNFRLIEGKYEDLPLNEIKKDYMACELTIPELREKYDLSVNNWDRIRRQFKKEGVPMRTLKERANPKHHTFKIAKNYYQTKNGKWRVQKVIDGKYHHFGTFDTEEEAQAKVKELKENGWNGYGQIQD